MSLQRCSTSLIKQDRNRELAKHVTAKAERATMKIKRTGHSASSDISINKIIFKVLRGPKVFFGTRKHSAIINVRGKRKENKSMHIVRSFWDYMKNQN